MNTTIMNNNYSTSYSHYSNYYSHYYNSSNYNAIKQKRIHNRMRT